MGRGEQSGLQGASALFDRRRNRRGANALERYFAYGVRPTEARAFLEQGVEARIAGELVRHGIGAEEARAALGAEIDYEELVRWLDAGFSVEEARQWREAGVAIEQACAWRPVLSRERMLARAKRTYGQLMPGSVVETLLFWQEQGIDDPLELLRRLNEWAKISPQPARIPSPADWLRGYALSQGSDLVAHRVSRRPGSAELYGEMLEAGFDDPTACDLAACAISVNEAKAWFAENPGLTAFHISAMHDAGLTPRQYARWREQVDAFPEDVAVACARAGITDPAEAGDWLELARDPSCLQIFQERLVKDAISAGVEPHELRAALVEHDCNPRAVIDYAARGGSVMEYCGWLEHDETRGLSNDTLEKLKNAGLTPELAGLVPTDDEAYRSRGVPELSSEAISDVSYLIRRQADPGVVRDLRALAAQRQPANRDERYFEAVGRAYDALQESGMSTSELGKWLSIAEPDVGLEDAIRAAQAWRERGFGRDEALAWSTPTMLERVGRERLPQLAAEARAAGLTPRQAGAWFKEGLSPAEAAAWRRAGIKRAADARGLRDHGISPDRTESLKPYIKRGISPAQALGWLDAGLSAEQAAEWQAAGITDGRLAAEWIESGVGLEQAARYERRRRESGS